MRVTFITTQQVVIGHVLSARRLSSLLIVEGARRESAREERGRRKG